MGYEGNVFFDFSLLGDFSYYTGLVFEGYGEGAGVPLQVVVIPSTRNLL